MFYPNTADGAMQFLRNTSGNEIDLTDAYTEEGEDLGEWVVHTPNDWMVTQAVVYLPPHPLAGDHGDFETL